MRLCIYFPPTVTPSTRASEAAGRALEATEMSLEPAGRASGEGGSTFKTISPQNGEHVAKNSQSSDTAKIAKSPLMFSLSCRFDYKIMKPKGIFSSEMNIK